MDMILLFIFLLIANVGFTVFWALSGSIIMVIISVIGVCSAVGGIFQEVDRL